MANEKYPFKGRATVIDHRITKNVKTLRVEAGLTQLDLALAVGCGLDLIRMIEQGRRKLKLSEAILLCPLLNCSLADFAKMDGEQLALSSNEEEAA
jgi:transcriptional regulator with XRE-family HTH domain